MGREQHVNTNLVQGNTNLFQGGWVIGRKTVLTCRLGTLRITRLPDSFSIVRVNFVRSAAVTGVTWVGVGIGVIGNRAMQCNNPGGVEHKGNRRWRGMMAEQGDPDLVRFKSAFWGLVALARMLGKVEREQGQCTTGYLLSNCYSRDASKCIKYVLKVNWWEAHTLLPLSEDAMMLDVMASVCRYQCGLAKRGIKLPYGVRVMQAAIRYAWPQWFNLQKEPAT